MGSFRPLTISSRKIGSMSSRLSDSSVHGTPSELARSQEGHQGRAEVLQLAVRRGREPAEVQIAHRVDELGGHELRIGAVELDRVERSRMILLGELEEVDPMGLLRGHRIEEARDRVAVRVDEGEAPSGSQVVGGEGDELGALARSRPPEQHEMAGEQALGHEDRAAGVEPDRPQAGLRGDDRRREAPAPDRIDRPRLLRGARETPQFGEITGRHPHRV